MDDDDSYMKELLLNARQQIFGSIGFSKLDLRPLITSEQLKDIVKEPSDVDAPILLVQILLHVIKIRDLMEKDHVQNQDNGVPQ